MNENDSRPRQLFHPAILAFAAAAILLRVVLSFELPRTIKWDEPSYLLSGYNLLRGNGFTYNGYPELHFPPLYPIISGLFYLCVGDFEKASNLAYAVFGGLLVVPVFVMAQRIYGVRTAWLSAILTAIFPALSVNVLYWGTLTEPLYLILLYGALALLFVGLEDGRLRMFPAAGILFGLAYLTRPEAVAYLSVFLVFACTSFCKALKRARTWYVLMSFVVPFLVLAMPYIFYLYAHTGQWMISGKLPYVWQEASSSNRMFGSNLMPDGEIAWLSPKRFQVSIQPSAPIRPEDILRRVIKNARKFKDQFFEGGNFWWGLTPLVVVALFKQPWDRPRLRHEAFLITIILVLMLTFFPFFYLARLFAPAFPVLLMWTAQGAIHLGGWLQDTVEVSSLKSLSKPHVKSLLGWLPAAMVIGFMIVMIPLAARGWIGATVYGDKEAGLWLRLHTPVDAKVMTGELGVALYADRRWVPSPHTDWVSFLRYARNHDANYLVVRDYKLAQEHPELDKIIEEGTPELDLVFSFQESHMPGAVKTLVYRISTIGDKSKQEERPLSK